MKRDTIYVPAADTEYTLANEIKGDYNTHIASATYHVAADTANAVGSADSTSLATVLLLANEFKADYNAHLKLSTAHRKEDTHNVVTHANAQDEATVFSLLNEIKRKYNVHIADAEIHKAADSSNAATSGDAADDTPDIDIQLEQGNALLVQLTGSSCTGTVDFQATVDGATFANTPYIAKNSVTAAKTVAQISAPGTAATYILLPPLTQVRIACSITVGSLSIVYREIQYSRPFDGAFADDEVLSLGGSRDARILYETADANAKALVVTIDESDDSGNNVPVFIFGEETNILNADLGAFDEVVQPHIVAMHNDGQYFASAAVTSDDGGATTEMLATGIGTDAVVGDIIRVIAGTNATAGWYVITTVDSANEVTLTTNWCTGDVTGGSIISFHQHCILSANGVYNRLIDGALTAAMMDIDRDGIVALDIGQTNGRWYWWANGAAHYVNATAGMEIPAGETDCPSCGKPMEVGEAVAPVLNERLSDGAMHGLWHHADCVVAQKHFSLIGRKE